MGLPLRAPASAPIQAQLDAVNARIDALAASTLQIGPHQKSTVPGELIAGRITTPVPPGKPRMMLDLIQNGQGLGPIIKVNDGTYDRAQMGNLASYTGPNGVNSPAQYGFRALDGSGNNIFDSLGLISVAVAVPGTPLILGAGSTTSLAYVVAVSGPTSASITVTPIRNTTYLTLYTIATQQGGGAGVFGNARSYIDGAPRQDVLVFDGTLGAAYANSAAFDVASLAAGSHTIDIRISSDGVNTLSFSELTLLVIQLGA